MPVRVDSSLWVHQLRKSADPAKRDRVNALLESGEAAWCLVVRLELWRGVTNDAERKTLRRYEALLPDYEISAAVWTRSMQLADRARASGVSAPSRICS
jgi:predicted nucleic acid-binding protein